MVEFVGDFNEALGAAKDGLELTFSASSLPLKQRWRNNGLSADFLADYVTTFFPGDEREEGIRGAVSYIANELLENAMKYGEEHEAQPSNIKLLLTAGGIVFMETNAASSERGRDFFGFVKEMADSDPGEMYIRQLERAGEGTSSGLGLLTMMNDYGATLGWRFEDLDDGAVRVTTQVRLSI